MLVWSAPLSHYTLFVLLCGSYQRRHQASSTCRRFFLRLLPLDSSTLQISIKHRHSLVTSGCNASPRFLTMPNEDIKMLFFSCRKKRGNFHGNFVCCLSLSATRLGTQYPPTSRLENVTRTRPPLPCAH